MKYYLLYQYLDSNLPRNDPHKKHESILRTPNIFRKIQKLLVLALMKSTHLYDFFESSLRIRDLI